MVFLGGGWLLGEVGGFDSRTLGGGFWGGRSGMGRGGMGRVDVDELDEGVWLS